MAKALGAKKQTPKPIVQDKPKETATPPPVKAKVVAKETPKPKIVEVKPKVEAQQQPAAQKITHVDRDTLKLKKE